MSKYNDIRVFSVTERVNDNNSEYYDEIRRSRSLTRKPVGNRPQSSENPKIKIRYNVKSVLLENASPSGNHYHHHHHHKSNSINNHNDNLLKNSTISLSSKKDSRSLILSIKSEGVDKNTRLPSHSYKYLNTPSERSSSSHPKRERGDNNSKHHHSNNHNHSSSHNRSDDKFNITKEKLSPNERYYDKDNPDINNTEDKGKHKNSSGRHKKDNDELSKISKKSKHDHSRSSNHQNSKNKSYLNENSDKENISIKKTRNEKKKTNKTKLENENDSASLNSLSINQRHREKRLKDKVRDYSSSKDQSSLKSHTSSRNDIKENKENEENKDISKYSKMRGSNSSIVPTYPRPLSPKKINLKNSKTQLENENDMSNGMPQRSSSVLSRNRSLSRSRSVSISNQVSVYSSDGESFNQPKNRLTSSYNELPLYKSNESMRELRQNVLRKYTSLEVLPSQQSNIESRDKNTANHTSAKRSVSNDTSKLRHSHNMGKDSDMDEQKKKKKSRSHSLSVSGSKSERQKKNEKDKKIKKNEEKKNDNKPNEINDEEELKDKKEGQKSNEGKEKRKHHKSKDKDSSSKNEKKIKRHANVPAPIPDESIRKKRANNSIKEKNNDEDDQDLAIKPVMPISETPKNTNDNKDIITFYPEGYTPSITESVKTKVNEYLEEDINPEKKKTKKSRSKSHSHSRSRSHHKSRSRSKSKNRHDSVDNDDLTKENHKKHSRKHKSKTLSDENSTIIEKLEEYPYENNIFENLKKKPEDFKNSNICIHIYRTDPLELNIRNVHPLVKVHVVDINTEKYLTKSSALRPATSYYENSEVGYIMPILTQPYYLQKNHTNIPRWNQGLYINEDYLHVVRKNVIIFFEIIDFVERAEDRKKDKDGWHRIAWAFLKLIGTHDMVNTEHTRRLQLYKYPKKLIKNQDPKKPEVIEYWKRKLVKYQSTLFVKIYSQKIPETKEVSYRPKMPNEKEIGAWTYNQLIDTYLSKKKILDPVYKSFINFSQKPSWRREDGQLCKIPNHLHFRIDGGERGCLSAEYSHLGYLFAIASTSINSVTTIKIFDTVSGDKIASLTGHQDLVYDIKWSHDDKHLFSASADGSVRAWSIQSETTIRPSTIFQHPSYVYCIQIHPIIGQDNKITVITGSYDGKIRFWKYDQNIYNDIELLKQTPNHHQTQFLPAYVLTGHESTINSLAIESTGIRLFSADGNGVIRVWSCRVNDSVGYNNYKCIKVIPTQSDPINCIRLHPNERQLLVHCLGNTIYMMDVRLFKVLTCITSLPSSHYPIKSILSPCGTYIFSGSINGQVFVFNSMTGKLVAKYENLTISQPIMGIVYHPLDDYISFYTYGPEQPILTYVWDSNYKPLESLLKIDNTEDTSNKMFDLMSNKFIDEEKKFPYSSFNNIDKNSTNDNLNLSVGLRNKQGFRQFDDPFKAKSVFI
jgi:WD40 repeat protein